MDLVYVDPRPTRSSRRSCRLRRVPRGRGEQRSPAGAPRRSTSCSAAADVVSLHLALDDHDQHVIDAARLAHMKDDAILVNSARGPLVDEAALVEHCRAHPSFSAALDVFEHEPRLAPGLLELPNVVAVPHLGSATGWTRRGMATLAAANVVGVALRLACLDRRRRVLPRHPTLPARRRASSMPPPSPPARDGRRTPATSGRGRLPRPASRPPTSAPSCALCSTRPWPPRPPELVVPPGPAPRRPPGAPSWSAPAKRRPPWRAPLERHWPAPLTGLVVTPYGHAVPCERVDGGRGRAPCARRGRPARGAQPSWPPSPALPTTISCSA